MNDKRANGAAVAQRFYTPSDKRKPAENRRADQAPKRRVYADVPLGTRFGRWTVLAVAPRHKAQFRWLVRCDCGAEHERIAQSLVEGRSTQCNDCGVKDGAAIRTLPVPTRENGRRRPEYATYTSMLERCDDPTRKYYYRYGGRGIGVCDRWREGFANFYADVGPRPGKGYTLERIDNDGDYEPTNVRWATRKEQARNTRRNHVIEIDGRALCIAAWAEELGIRPQAISLRLRRGWSERDAVFGRSASVATTPQRLDAKERT